MSVRVSLGEEGGRSRSYSTGAHHSTPTSAFRPSARDTKAWHPRLDSCKIRIGEFQRQSHLRTRRRLGRPMAETRRQDRSQKCIGQHSLIDQLQIQ